MGKIGHFNTVTGIGLEMHRWAEDLFPVNRSLTGPGVRQTLDYLKGLIPELTLHAIPSGTQVFDWNVPNEWHARAAWIKGPNGEKIVDFAENTLHLVGYSIPVHTTMSLEELQERLHSLPDQIDAIPYVTSYYKEDWGFCLTDRVRQTLSPGDYEIFIDTTLAPGVLNYAELLLNGESDQEIFISTYVCHPSMANNELSGIVVATALAQWVLKQERTKFSYRFVFIPETIGSIVYLSKNLKELKSRVYAGFNLTCIGDDRAYSFLPSRAGNTIADRAALSALRSQVGNAVQIFDWLDRGSDERQYCAPGIDLPVASIMRSKYGTYPEYHTSLDNLDFVTPTGLFGGFNAARLALEIIEKNYRPLAVVLGEPQLGKRGLYSTQIINGDEIESRVLLHILSMSDGEKDLIMIAERINLSFDQVYSICEILIDHQLLERR